MPKSVRAPQMAGAHAKVQGNTEFQKAGKKSIRNEDDASSTSSSEDDGEIEPVVNPSQDIKNDLKIALAHGFEFTGSFAFSTNYSAAPNPSININGFGALGLPLNSLEAKRLIGVCSQAPFGKKEKTIVDKKVRDTWELDPSRFDFLNPGWDTWVQSTIIPQVCKGLGVKQTVVQPVAEIYKLLLYETGSHFLPHQDTEKSTGMFGTIVIVLPSQHEGGSLLLTHGGQSKVFDYAASSLYSTPVYAWYTDVFHSVKPVLSGYRLALTYNLIQPPSVVTRPLIPQSDPYTAKLRHVLLSWRQCPRGEGPSKLAYILDHHYSLVGLGATALKGKDAHLVSFLRPIAEELGIKVYIANFELHEVGMAENCGPPRRHCWYDSDDGGSDAEMAEVEESELEIKNIMDLDGHPVDANIDVDESDMIPIPLNANQPDDKEYEGYQGNYGGSLEYWYNRTALLIFPQKRELEATGVDPLDHSLWKLESKLDRGWEPRHRKSKHINLALDLASTTTNSTLVKRALLVLTFYARASNDSNLWIRAVRAYGVVAHLDRLGSQGLVDAVNSFGFEPICPILEEAILNNQLNHNRFEIVDAFAEKAGLDKNHNAQNWAMTQTRVIEKSLRPLVVLDVSRLIITARTRGIAYFSSIIVPQIVSLSTPPNVLHPLLKHLHEQRSHWKAEIDTITNVIATLLSLFLNALPAPQLSTLVSHRTSIIQAIKICNELDAVSELQVLVLKIEQLASTTTESTKGTLAKDFLLPLLGDLEALFEQCSRLEEGRSVFAPLHALLGQCLRQSFSLYQFETNIPVLIKTAYRAGGLPWLTQWLKPLMKGAQLPNSALSAVRMLALCLHQQKGLFVRGPHDPAILQDLLCDMISYIASCTSFSHSGLSGFGPSGCYGGTLSMLGAGIAMSPTFSHTAALEVFKFCFDFGDSAIALCTKITPFIRPPASIDEFAWFRGWFQPFITDLRVFLRSVKISITRQPFRSIIATITKRFISKVGKKPIETISVAPFSMFGCGCQPCSNIRVFLMESSGREWRLSAVQSIRTHLEKQLAVLKSKGLTWTTVKFGSPHTLVVYKPDALIAPAQWKERSQPLLRFITGLGNGPTLRAIYKESLESYFEVLNAPLPANVPAVASSSNASSVPVQPAKLNAPPKATTSRAPPHAHSPTATSTANAKRPSVASASPSREPKRPRLSNLDTIVLSD